MVNVVGDTARRYRWVVGVVTVALFAAGCTGSDAADPAEVPGAVVLGDGDTYEATIVRTEGGVPHITGDSVADVSFGQGWASGEDRTCDLADMVVKLNGERARWFGAGDGDANINSDIAANVVGVRQLADDDWASVSDNVREGLTAFAAGWNAHLDHVGVDGINGWCAGEPWVKPVDGVDVYAWSRAVALLASAAAVEDFVAAAQPPAATDSAVAEAAVGDLPDTADNGQLPGVAVASNAWAIGADRSATGGGMLVGNPHFPWEGALRFWEVHLTIPGEVDIYGAQLSGLPGIGIGFTNEFAWTHTVSAGNRFTAYLLDLVPGDPTSYRYGDTERQMEPVDITIEVLGDDGELTTETVTRWRSHYGPMLDFPGVGWTDTAAITMRDANIDNNEFIEQYFTMLEASSLDDLIDAHRTWGGVPLFNTIAVSADGRAWYADTSATPRLSPQALDAYEELKATNPVIAIAADNGAVLLDGSDPVFEWSEVPGARDPGLVPFDEMPVLERSDYVFNANDSFWMSHGQVMLEGDYSPLHGPQGTARTPRTRENATLLDDTGAGGPAGDDGLFTLDELSAAALANTGFTARMLREDVVERCGDAPPVTVEAVGDAPDGGLPASTVDLTDACGVLASWDGVYDTESRGAVLWREFVGRFSGTELRSAGTLWAQPFDPADPLGTPSGLAPAPSDDDDPVLVNLARATQVLDAAGLPLDVPLGEVQVAVRNGEVIPIHGGNSADGTPNQVGWLSAGQTQTADPAVESLTRVPVAPGASLADVDGDGTDTRGYRINNGTSFLFAVAYGPDGPEARAMLTYANTEDRTSADYVDATRQFSDKQWRTVAFTPDEVRSAAESTTVVRG